MPVRRSRSCLAGRPAVDRVAQFIALFVSTRRDTPPPRGLLGISTVAAGHEMYGQGGALVAALVPVDLDNQLLAFLDLVLDARLPGSASRSRKYWREISLKGRKPWRSVP